MARQRNNWRACRDARERANAADSVRTIGVGKTYIHQHCIVAARYGGNGVTDFALPKLPPVTPSGPFYFICIGGAVPPRG